MLNNALSVQLILICGIDFYAEYTVYLFESILQMPISVKKFFGDKTQICKKLVKNCVHLYLVKHWTYHDVSYVK